MRSFHRALVALVLALVVFAPAHAGPITQMFVFGDSLSDAGNVFAATGGTTPDPANYPSGGRYSNGPVWAESLATQLGVGPLKASLLGGTDYAFGGAETGTGLSPKGTPNLQTQISQYLAAHPGQASSSQLFVVWAGANDVFDGKTNYSASAANVHDAVQTLASHGAKNFLVLGVPDLGKTPYGIGAGGAQQAALSGWTQGYNTFLAAEMATLHQSLGVKITFLDTNALFAQVQNNPGAFGFANASDRLQTASSPSGKYLFWDDVHPTSDGHKLIADAASSAVTATPEPSTLAMLMTGMVGFGGFAWRRRR